MVDSVWRFLQLRLTDSLRITSYSWTIYIFICHNFKYISTCAQIVFIYCYVFCSSGKKKQYIYTVIFLLLLWIGNCCNICCVRFPNTETLTQEANKLAVIYLFKPLFCHSLCPMPMWLTRLNGRSFNDLKCDKSQNNAYQQIKSVRRVGSKTDQVI